MIEIWFRREITLLIITMNSIFHSSVVSLVSGASEVAKIAKNETIFTGDTSGSGLGAVLKPFSLFLGIFDDIT